MAKEIHILLSRKSWQEISTLKENLNKDLPDFLKQKVITYEEYLEQEKQNPSMALLGQNVITFLLRINFCKTIKFKKELNISTGSHIKMARQAWTEMF